MICLYVSDRVRGSAYTVSLSNRKGLVMFKVTVNTHIGETSWKHSIENQDYGLALFQASKHLTEELDKRGWCDVELSQGFTGPCSHEVLIRDTHGIIGTSRFSVMEV